MLKLFYYCILLLSYLNSIESKNDFNFQFSQYVSQSSYPHVFIKNLEELQHLRYISGLLILVERKCVGSMDFCNKDYLQDLLNESNYWLIFDESPSSMPNNIYFPIKSNVFVISQNTNDEFNVATIFKYSKSDARFTEHHIGTWTQEEGFKNGPNMSLQRQRLNLQGTPLRASFYYSYIESMSHTEDFREVEKDNILKICYMVLTAMADYLNATFIPSFIPNFGLNLDANSNLYEDNSMLGEVQRDRADITGITGFITHDRLHFFRYFGPMSPDSVRFFFRAPPVSLVQNVYLMPFDSPSWYCIGAILLIGVGVLFVILVQEEQSVDFSGEAASIVDVIMIFLSALLQKSWHLNFNSFSGRFTLAVTYITFMVIYNAYSASIIVFLQGNSETIKSFDDLYNAKFDIAVQDVNYNRYYFTSPTDRTDEYWRQKIYKEKIHQKNTDTFYLTLSKGIEKMHTDVFGFQAQVSSAYHEINKVFTQAEKCGVRSVPTIYRVDDLYLATLKNSSYFNHYKVGIRRMFEHGLQRRAFVRLFTPKLRCEGNTSFFKGIGLAETLFIFKLFLSGILLSFMLLLTEILLSRFLNSARYYALLRKTNFIFKYTE